MNGQIISLVLCALVSFVFSPSKVFSQEINRQLLPVVNPEVTPITEIDARKAAVPPRFEVQAPQGAPNVVIVLIDDMGFGQPSAFGGPVHMPTCEKLARNGLKFNRFHTTAVCSPTRMALLTARNHHSCNMGSITETATAFPGQTGIRPQNIAPLAEVLRLNGYSTAHFGKNHETPPWEISPSGPFDRCRHAVAWTSSKASWVVKPISIIPASTMVSPRWKYRETRITTLPAT
jgi:arylsulfatase